MKIGALIALTISLSIYVATSPPASPLRFEDVRQSAQPSDFRLLDRRGRVLHELRTDPQRRRLAWVTLSDISPALRSAVVGSEDRRFFSHAGVDLRAVVSALADVVRGGRPRGASTITMQLASILEPRLRRSAQSRSVFDKWRQMRAAWALEESWSKDQILEAYLNRVSFRGEVEGIAAASAVLFGKSPHSLTQAEAVVLAALLPNPNATAAAVRRRAQRIMANAEAESSIEKAIAHVTGDRRSRVPVSFAPHLARRVLPDAGNDVQSTIDLDAQIAAQSALQRALLDLKGRRVSDGAVLVADNSTGAVLAYIGSSGKLSAAPHVDGVQARRQPGSALKPFLYALAIEERLLTAASHLDDSPLEIPVATGLYRPENYDERFRGFVSVRTALASSLNIPAVRAVQLIGVERFASHLRTLGFAGLTRPGSYYGPALALGSAEVSLWEMVAAYRALANGGQWSALRLAPDENTAEAHWVYSPATAFIVADILADRESRSATFGLESPLSTRFWTAVKTGTSKDMRDNWCVGFSGRYTVGVWVGNFSGHPMGDVSGVSGAAPVWLEVMQWLHREHTSLAPSPPEGVLRRRALETKGGELRFELFLEGTGPGAAMASAPALPRIVAPPQSTVIAIDPEIPVGLQRVVFKAEVGEAAIDWLLDGTRIGSSTDTILWQPVTGRHELLLVDRSGRALDRVTFSVRNIT